MAIWPIKCLRLFTLLILLKNVPLSSRWIFESESLNGPLKWTKPKIHTHTLSIIDVTK
jgi:hypothetical protein